jgi:putative transcriptional regulator
MRCFKLLNLKVISIKAIKMNTSCTCDNVKEEIKAALECSKVNKINVVVDELTSLDIKNIRAKFGMSQDKFASAFGLNVGSLRHWERGARTPNISALVLLNVINKEPLAVINALRKQITG